MEKNQKTQENQKVQLSEQTKDLIKCAKNIEKFIENYEKKYGKIQYVDLRVTTWNNLENYLKEGFLSRNKYLGIIGVKISEPWWDFTKIHKYGHIVVFLYQNNLMNDSIRKHYSLNDYDLFIDCGKQRSIIPTYDSLEKAIKKIEKEKINVSIFIPISTIEDGIMEEKVVYLEKSKFYNILNDWIFYGRN